MVIWLIGLSGSGKTTIANSLYSELKSKNPSLVRLDGDEFRAIFQNDTDHTIGGRQKNAERISNFCKVLDQQGINVIASVLSIFPEWQEWNRNTFTSYFEVFLDIPIEIVAKRDPKNIYKNATFIKKPNIVGIDIPFPKPVNPDLIISPEQQASGVNACVNYILSKLPKLQ